MGVCGVCGRLNDLVRRCNERTNNDMGEHYKAKKSLVCSDADV